MFGKLYRGARNRYYSYQRAQVRPKKRPKKARKPRMGKVKRIRKRDIKLDTALPKI